MLSSLSSQDGAPQTQEDPKPARSEAFWFHSGDVVLHVENTRFRVHCEMLSRHSNIFKDTFSMPQFTTVPGHSDEAFVDGCPVVPLFDKASDVGHMLSVFYDNFQTHDWREQMDIDHLSALLRLGKKYEIDYFTKEALRRLRSECPATLNAWDDRDVYGKEGDIVFPLEVDDVTTKIINLAHEVSLPSVLPAAYLRYVQDGTMRSIAEETRICSQDRIHCILGRASVLDFICHKLARWHEREVFTPGEDCSSRKACGVLRRKTVDPDSFLLWGGFDGEYGPIRTLGVDTLSEFCSGCRRSIYSSYNRNRAELWEKLPTFFGLPEWEELKGQDFDKYSYFFESTM
ncbi:hypothetical protein GALMADRAFT_758598 [Galerina marginata CBS 339.88]|uniref:BTB domain-containing protein n=1 Tax=Galerina marginata (strain CBS 339.88) TaxID=685588 RepID=A0A067SRH5_GALM3|nr:hypothetical protein GALMADRAFT_758598 [Galerina marginata CBS 339.88]